MAQGVLTVEHLKHVVKAYKQFGEFTFDVETMGEHRGNPHRNEVFWISLSTLGRCDVIPCGHPVGERIPLDPNDEYHRINPSNRHFQEHRINESSGRLKWFDIPEPFDEPPKQLWVSDVMDMLSPLFFSDRRKICHNVKFDVGSVTKYYGEIPPGPYGDTITAAKLVNENHLGGYKLGQAVKREFHFEYEKIGKEVERYPYSEAHMYSYYDAKYTWLLWEKLKPLMDREGIRHIFDLEMDLLPAILDLERKGITLDEKALDALGVEFSKEMARLKVRIDKAAGYEINLNANAQVAKLVYETLGHTCKVYTPSGQPSTASDTLDAFRKDPIVAKVGEYAKLSKLQSSFVIGLKKEIHQRRIHPSLNPMGTVTGRMSCSQPNIQQIPSRSENGKRVREVFIAGRNKMLIVADLSQIELRVLAHFTQDPRLLKAYREGLDLHGLLAARVFGKDYKPIDRTYAKNGHFSVLFGASAATLVRRYGFPNIKLAEQVQAGFYSTYKNVEPWKQEVFRLAMKKYDRKKKVQPYVETILGRKRRLPDLHSTIRGVRSGAERQAISSIIQGSAADYFKLAMMDCYDTLQEQSWEGHIIMTVHDELVVEVPERYAEEGLVIVKHAMEGVKHPDTGEPLLSLPIVADARIAKRWSEGKGQVESHKSKGGKEGY